MYTPKMFPWCVNICVFVVNTGTETELDPFEYTNLGSFCEISCLI